LLSAGDDLISEIIDTALSGGTNPTEGWCVNVLLSRFVCNTLEERR